MERPLSERLEAQAAIKFSPDPKLITDNGRSLVASARAIVWANRYFGATGEASYSRLWTSQFNKTAWLPAPGIVFRLKFLGNPTRMYLDYLIPTGSIDTHGIESSRLKGPEYYAESRLASMGPVTMRLGFKLNAYHFFRTGKPAVRRNFWRIRDLPQDGSLDCRHRPHAAL